MYKKKIDSIDELHQIEKDMLQVFVNFCNEHELDYFLSYGSALGAHRHKGFIPWDDDIDICLLRKDYDKLINLVKSNNQISKPYKINIPGSKSYPYSFIKVINENTELLEPELSPKYRSGIWIDVFPIDHISKKISNNIQVVNNINFFNNLLHNGALNIYQQKSYKKKINIIISRIILKIFTVEKISLQADRIARKYDKKNIKSTLLSEIVWYNDKKEIYKIDELIPHSNGFFENISINLPNNIHSYLTIKYGKDYMKLPDLDNQKTHNFIAYWVGEKHE